MTMHYAPPTAADRRNARRDASDARYAERLQERAAASAEALAEARASGWAELVGSEKQVAWALRIRASVAHASTRITSEVEHAGLSMLLFGMTEAAYWCDHNAAQNDTDEADRLVAQWATIARIARGDA